MGSESVFGTYYGPIILDNLLCNGEEDDLLQCSVGQGTHECSDYTQNAGVQCMQESACKENSLRLVPNNDLTAEQLYLMENQLQSFYFIDDEIHRGRLEICVNGTWGAVCYDGTWSNVDARVACGQLGFSSFGRL